MKHDERGGILLALTGFILFTIGDTITKTVSGDWSPVALATLRFAFGAIPLGLILLVREGAGAFIPRNPWLQMARGVLLGLTTLMIWSSFFLMPLAVSTAIAFVAPAITALLSAPLLGEKVRPVVWLACGLAFAGVLIILRPNFLALGWLAILPLLGALFMSLLMIANRASVGQGSSLSMQFFVAAGGVPTLAIATVLSQATGLEMFQITPPDWSVIIRAVIAACTGTLGHWLIYMGTMRAGASTIAPATYVQLLMATALGWAVFGDMPDWPTMIGSAIIIGAGLLLWQNGRLLASSQAR